MYQLQWKRSSRLQKNIYNHCTSWRLFWNEKGKEIKNNDFCLIKNQVYEGEGDDGEFGGATGDLIVYFEVEAHPFYHRANATSDDVYCRVTVSFPQALLGGQIEVPSMYGDKTLFVKLDPGTQHEQLYKVQDEGFYSISKQKKGDLYVQICLAVPKTLDEEEKELLRKLAKRPNFKSLYKAM